MVSYETEKMLCAILTCDVRELLNAVYDVPFLAKSSKVVSADFFFTQYFPNSDLALIQQHGKMLFKTYLLTTFPLSLKRISRLMSCFGKKAYSPNKHGMLQFYNIDAFHNNTLEVHNLNEK